MSDIYDAVVGQWYLRRDTNVTFWVTDYDDQSRTAEIQTSDGDLDELDEEVWQSLSLDLAEPPQDWTGPMDGTSEDQEDLEAGPAQLESSASPGESWEDGGPPDEIDEYTARNVSEDVD
jgi:hypothetical protein